MIDNVIEFYLFVLIKAIRCQSRESVSFVNDIAFWNEVIMCMGMAVGSARVLT